MSTAPPPVKIGIISAGPTAIAKAPIQKAGLQILLQEDLPTSEAQPNDVGLIWFLSFFNALGSRARTFRPFSFAIVGNAQDRPRVRGGFERLLGLDVDLIVWWTFAAPLLPGEPLGPAGYDDLLGEATRRNIAVVFPAPSGLGDRNPDLFPVCGVTTNAPFLDVCPTPHLWTAMPAVAASWGDWGAMRQAWIDSGLPEYAPPHFDYVHGHSLAVWAITAFLALNCAASATRPTISNYRANLKNFCVPVVTRPDDSTPAFGFFEPRQLDVVTSMIEAV